jgi:hypothetical protein
VTQSGLLKPLLTDLGVDSTVGGAEWNKLAQYRNLYLVTLTTVTKLMRHEIEDVPDSCATVSSTVGRTPLDE